MKPEAALRLVHAYSAIQWAIKECKPLIARELDKCPQMGFSPETPFGKPDAYPHLKDWLKPIIGGNEFTGPEEHWRAPSALTQQECPHCHRAFELVRRRKALRKRLAGVKAAMTRATPKPAILEQDGES